MEHAHSVSDERNVANTRTCCFLPRITAYNILLCKPPTA